MTSHSEPRLNCLCRSDEAGRIVEYVLICPVHRHGLGHLAEEIAELRRQRYEAWRRLAQKAA